MIKPSSSSHWYKPDGSPAYDATLRDARKQPLYPSVTQVIGQLAKPAVEAWAVNLMSETCYQNPAIDGYGAHESIDSYRKRIEPLYQKKREEAANVGSAIHDFAEAYLNGKNPELVEGYEIQCENLAAWIHDKIDSAICEETFACVNEEGFGYGGRIDAYGFLKDGKRFLLDFKTQNMKGKKTPAYYPEWKYQLAAYAEWLTKERAVLSLGENGLSISKELSVFSVVIDTSENAGIHVKEYSQEELSAAYHTFTLLLELFYTIKGLPAW